EGDLKHRVKVFRNDELGRVSQAFNEMTKRLKVYNARLNEIATHDNLTGLYNHREFYNQLENEAELTKRYGLFFSLAIFDLDFFKKINDKYGHKAGDVVLAAVAGTIKQTARLHDICARYGGEEFAVILPQTHKEDGIIIAKRICAQIASNPIVIDDETDPVKLTISAGVAEFERDAKDIEGLFNKADSALYNAKETGRNRVVVYREAA
ncbi:MAG: GGDEF domain-containing protein, partial [Actinomycetia bacterium]|nr:GGDEF domain-containing protein [Actinomycetes bacterium]